MSVYVKLPARSVVTATCQGVPAASELMHTAPGPVGSGITGTIWVALAATMPLLGLAITHGARWKVSLHLGGIAGSVTVFVLLFGPPLLVLTPLVALVGWARWRVGAHTAAQAVAATVLAVGITLGTLWVMRVPVAFPR